MNEAVCIEERASAELGEKYAVLRIVSPRSEAAMEKSLRVHGQLTPVVLARGESGDELVDGFKRVRALRRMGESTVTARILETSPRASKAALIQLNKASKSLTTMEEAFVVHSLHKEDGLNQVEIGVLLGRHKSWVCRRLILIAQLDEDVKQEVRLGLLPVVTGIEVARLQRCNQKAAVTAIHKHGLTTRQATKLVSYLLTRPKYEYEAILYRPWELFENPPPRSDLRGRLWAMHRICRGVVGALATADGHEISEAHDRMDEAIGSAQLAAAHLQRILEGPRE